MTFRALSNRLPQKKCSAIFVSLPADAGSCPGNCPGMEKRLEHQAHSRAMNRGGRGLPVATGAVS